MKTSENRIHAVALTGICAAVAMVLSYVEFLLPPIFPPLPAVKCGLANIAVLFALYRLGKGKAALVALIKIALTALLFGSAMSLAYSAAGGLLSFLTSLLLMQTKRFSPMGVSIGSAVMHNAGQIFAAMVITSTFEVIGGLPILIITGTLAGCAVGIAGGLLIKHVKL